EVDPETEAEADIALGTGGMIRYAGESEAGVFIVGTEVGMCYRLSKLYPEKTFIPASGAAVCPNMKKITLEKVLRSLETLEPVVTVPGDIADAARGAIERMMEIS
ncbi:MAG: quinolinate synthase NadA, partial [Candidatus Krumholzibacteria bacterium]|nr:quinolinate synthase NadA [Candidatus Krumholzibacteria bacterium]